jgi:hypothetical protein
MANCVKCGNSGRLLNGEPCDCEKSPSKVIKALTPTTHVSFVPKDYVGLVFSKEFVNEKIPHYADFLGTLHNQICNMCDLDKSLFISSPPRFAKQIFAYSIIQYLLTRGVEVFPYLDAGEIGRYLRDVDHGRKPKYLDKVSVEPESMYSAPVVFVKGTINPSCETLDHLATFVDRRHRQGNHTVILSHQRWSEFTRNDYNRSMRLMVGDGQINTIKIHDWGAVVNE